ncbi:DoxX family protein [Nocardioides pacificus]
MTAIRLLARPMLASMFVIGGAHALKNADSLAAAAKPVTDRLVPRARKLVPQVPIPEDPTTLVRINGGVQLAAGLALATGRAPRLSSAALAASLVPTTVAGHRFWEESDPQAKGDQRIAFFKNLSMLGGLLLASADTAGKPGVAWRAQHTARGVRREAKHLGKAARREAKLAAAKVG